jgi:DNA-binding XRE family transcriptional regulator
MLSWYSVSMTTTASKPRALTEELIGECMSLLRDGKGIDRKAMKDRHGISAGTVQRARDIAAERLRSEQGADEPARRRSPFQPGIDGRRLAELRFMKGLLTQGELAEKAGVSRVWIAKLEAGRGQPSVETLRALCSALDCTVADLLPAS